MTICEECYEAGFGYIQKDGVCCRILYEQDKCAIAKRETVMENLERRQLG